MDEGCRRAPRIPRQLTKRRGLPFRESSATRTGGIYATGKCPHCSKRYVLENENLMKFWDWNSNIGLDPAVLGVTSHNVVSWKCQICGYTWRSAIQNLKNNQGKCPCCDLHRVVVLGVSDVFTLVPEAKEYYDFEKNVDVDITTVNISSKQRVWWKCPTCNEETFLSFAAKIRKKVGIYHFGTCRKCYGSNSNMQDNKATNSPADLGIHSLSARLPNIAQLWSPNNERSAKTVTPDSSFYALWVCPDCNLEYRAFVYDMVNGNTTCPVCNNKRVQPGYNTLADKNPDIAKLWSKSNRIYATEILPTSSFFAHWLCPACGGEYDAPVRDMVSGIVECPYCAGRRPLSGFNTLADKYPAFATMWSAENDRHADSVLPNSAYEALWDCPECGGKYNASVQDMVGGITKCPYCMGKTVLPGFNSFAAKHPNLLKEWDYIHNYVIDIDPDAISDKNMSTVWWNCEHDHKFTMRVNRRILFEKRKKLLAQSAKVAEGKCGTLYEIIIKYFVCFPIFSLKIFFSYPSVHMVRPRRLELRTF